MALAMEDTSPESLLASIDYLKEERVVQGVALVGASAGGSAALRATNQDPEAADQLILLSATGDVSGLGEEPKVFVASEGEGMAEEVRQMAEEAPGDHNEVPLLRPEDGLGVGVSREDERLLMRATLQRLEEYGQGSA